MRVTPSRQDQRSGDNSVNIQGETVTVTQGLSYAEARQAALDVFEANFYRLAGLAKDTARKRAEELVDNFLAEAQKAGAPIDEAQNPDMQYAVFAAQKAFARSGDGDLGDLLVALLIDRAKQANRDLKQIVLNESLEVAPKLTVEQMDALSVIWLIKYTRRLGLTDLNGLEAYLRTSILPFVSHLTIRPSCYQHIEFSGCGSISLGSATVEHCLLNSYPGLLSKGVTPEEAKSSFRKVTEVAPSLIVPCLHDPARVQAGVLNEADVDTVGATVEAREDLKRLLLQARMSEGEVRKFVLERIPDLERLFKTWDESFMKNTTLTSVGIAIAAANARRRVGLKHDLGIWI